MSEILKKIEENVIAGRVDSEDEGFDGDMEGLPGVTELVEKAIDEGVKIKDILMDALTAGMQKVGKLYEDGEYLIPDMLASAECVGAGMDLLEPYLVDSDIETKGKFVIATVEGDLHDIGKNIVATIFKGAGYEVRDLGTGVTAEKICSMVKDVGADYVGLSALLTTTMPRMPEIIALLKKEGLRDKVKVLIGGAPISAEYADKIGADYYCEDAFDAIRQLEG